MPKLLRRFAQDGKPLLLRLSERARDLAAAGRPIIPLTMGEPAIATPDFILAAAAEAMRTGATRYTPVEGTPALRAGIRRKLSRSRGLDYGPDEVMASAGGLQVLANAFRATLRPGDEVIVFSPFWGPYEDIVGACGGRLRVIDRGEDPAAAFRGAVTARTRWLLINSPGNPSGEVFDRAVIEGLAEAMRAAPGVWTLCDEVYADLTYAADGCPSLLHVDPSLRDRVLILGGVSKSYAMTGWRLGYAAGSAPLIRAMTAVQAATTHNPSSVSQAAALVALDEGDDFLAAERDRYRTARDLMVARLNAMPGVRCAMPGGAFYAFPDVSSLIGRVTPGGRTLHSDIDLAEHLLEEANVATIPGRVFRRPDSSAANLRLFFGLEPAETSAALSRIEAALAALRV